MHDAIHRSTLLIELGYIHPDAQAAAVEVLVAAKLTNVRKANIAEGKRERCRAELRAKLVRLCTRCLKATNGDSRRPVPTAKANECEMCGGSNNRLAVDRAIAALREYRLRRLVVVGGSPSVHHELTALWPDDLSVRLVDGEDRQHNRSRASSNIRWADLVIIWGSTKLAHRVSQLYTEYIEADSWKVITIRRRGIEVLAAAIVEHLQLRSKLVRGA